MAPAALLAFGIFLSGCGGGGSASNPGNGGGGTGPTSSLVSGTVTNSNGDPVVGATVTLGSLTATTTQLGTYNIPSVPVGQQTITAAATINGKSYTGQNTMEVISGQSKTSDVHILVSDATTQGSITGTVVDNLGNALPKAKVFAQIPASNGTFFTTLGSIYAVADQTGRYTLPKLPNMQYTVTASYAPGGTFGYANQTETLQVASGVVTNANFTLTRSTTSDNGASTAKVTGFALQSFTVPATVSGRAATNETTTSGLNAIKQMILQKRGLLGHRFADAAKVTVTRTATRAAAGYIVENDLFWNYDTGLPYLLGYDIARSTTSANSGFTQLTLLRDPLADRFTDLGDLQAGHSYWYGIARVDTILFPQNPDTGEGDVVGPLVTLPLGPLTLTSPASGGLVAGNPVFKWSPVVATGTNAYSANLYQVYVYADYPAYTSTTDANGIQPVWPLVSDTSGAGSTTGVNNTTVTYGGPALTTRHKYYWVVVASDSTGSAVSISDIWSFVAN